FKNANFYSLLNHSECSHRTYTAWMGKVTRLSLYVINQAKFRKLVIGLSSKALGRILEHSDAYVGSVERPDNDNQYPPHEYPKLAKALEWTTHDLLPPDDMDQTSDGTLVDKVVLSLTNAADTRRVLIGMIDYGVFNQSKTFDDLVRYLYI